MRYVRQLAILLLPLLFVGLTMPSPVAAAKPADSPGAVHTDFEGLYFPAGYLDDGAGCKGIGVWMPPALCVTDPGSWTFLRSGRIRIRNMEVFELALAFEPGSDGLVVEPRKTGYDIVVANANLDGTLSGPTWGTWSLYNNLSKELMFTGTFTGTFDHGVPAVHFVGRGAGAYEGQHMRGDVGRVADPFNMFGTIVEPGS